MSGRLHHAAESVDFVAEAIALAERAARKLDLAAVKFADAGDSWRTKQATHAAEDARRLARSLAAVQVEAVAR